MGTLDKAIALAAQKHEGQFDKAGQPYIIHVLKVMHYLKTDDHNLMCIAVMHDLIEDTDVTVEYLKKLGFSIRIIDGVVRLTKIKGQSSDEYLARISESYDAVRVKMADLRHNSDIRRLKGVTEKDIKRIEKYHKMYKILEEVKSTMEHDCV